MFGTNTIGTGGIDVSNLCTAISGSPPTCSGAYLDARKALGVVAPLTSETVSFLLDYSGSQSNAGGSVWYINAKSVQQLAASAFDAINNQLAFSSAPPPGAAGPKIGLPVYSPVAIISGEPTVVTVSSLITSGNGAPVVPGSLSLLQVDTSGHVIATLGTLNDNGTNGDIQAGDNIFSGQFTFNLMSPGTLRLQISANFNGALNSTRSNIMPVEVLPAGVPVGAAPPSSNAPVTDTNGNAIACDRVVAFFAPGTSLTAITGLISSIGGHIIGFSPRIQAHAWEIGIPCSGSQGVLNAMNSLPSNPITVAAEPDFLLTAAGVTPSDPYFQYQVALKSIHADIAWAINTGVSGSAAPPPVIAIVDSGIDYTHEDLKAKIWSAAQSFTVLANGQSITCPAGSHGFNWVNHSCDPIDQSKDDDFSHGTFVAGIAGADTNNRVGIAGVSWASPLLAEKVNESGQPIDNFIAANGIIEAAARGAKVINCSFGGPLSYGFVGAIDIANQSGRLVVAGAGNNGSSQLFYPAGLSTSYPNVVSVGGIDDSGAIDVLSDYGTWVDIYAPFKTTSTDSNLSINIQSYTSDEGTSISTPFVSGAAALVWAANPNLSNADVKKILLEAADPGLADRSGNPTKVLNVFKAVFEAAAQTCTGCPQPPEVTVNGNQVSLGVPNRASSDTQSVSVHGVSVPLSPLAADTSAPIQPSYYQVTYQYNLSSWDTYNCCSSSPPPKRPGPGYWDSFSVSTSTAAYWRMGLVDPIWSLLDSFIFQQVDCPLSSPPSASQYCPFMATFLAGGGVLGGLGSTLTRSDNLPGQPNLTGSVSVGPGSGTGPTWLNLVLDTATLPDADNLVPSWGSFTVLDITPLCQPSNPGVCP